MWFLMVHLSFGYPNINDTVEVVELIACGSHVILFTTGRGSVVGSAIAPVIKVCANPTPTVGWPTTWTWTLGAYCWVHRR